VVAIDGKKLLLDGFNKLVPNDPKLLEQAEAAAKLVRENLRTNGPRTYTIRRGGLSDGQNIEFKFDWSPTTFGDQARPLFGVSIGLETVYTPIGFLPALGESATSLIGSIPGTVQAIVGGIFNTFTLQRDPNLAGPVGTVNVAGQVAQQGFWQVLFFAGLINLSLGIFNLLPIPGLDGGRIFLSAIVALVFVIIFIVLVTVQDFGRLGR
jgi:regulator of sigma E protease